MDKTTKTNQDQVLDEVSEEVTVAEPVHEDCEKRLQETESRYKRALADYQNLEKRIRDERGELIRLSNRELLLRFLPILDTLLLAQQHDKSESLNVLVSQFLDTLKSERVLRIKTEGEKFDPFLMEVVTTGEGKDGVVIQEVRAGYLLHDRLLRPAQVIVGSGQKEKEGNLWEK